MLATGADALLGRSSPAVLALLVAEKDVLELVHAGVGEEQGGVVGGHERRRVHAAMLLALEKAKEILANLASGAELHGFLSLAAVLLTGARLSAFG